MIRRVDLLIGLLCVGFLVGFFFQAKPSECATQVAPIRKATATMHLYRHTPYAVPFEQSEIMRRDEYDRK